MADFVLKVGDRNPSLRCILRDAAGAKNLAGASGVTFAMKSGTTVKSGAAVIEDSLGGVVRYDWAVGDTNTVGVYDAEFVVTESSKQQSFPNDRYISVEVKAEIA